MNSSSEECQICLSLESRMLPRWTECGRAVIHS